MREMRCIPVSEKNIAILKVTVLYIPWAC